jgi:endonuclease/exonuclease/phosphatase family metal-dependent hydrolase
MNRLMNTRIRRVAASVTIIGWALLAVPPCPAQTGTFLDRALPTDLRMFTYNVNFDQIFPQVSPQNAAKFQRLIRATQPDIVNLQEISSYSAEDVVALMNSIAPLPAGASWFGHKGSDNVIVSKYPLSLTRTGTIPAGDRGQAIAMVDLPDQQYARDFYLLNNHYKCCGGFDHRRQEQSDAIVNWLRDARTAGGFVELPGHTAMAVVGDLNIVDGLGPLNTLITGDILDEVTYGPDSPPDWDGSSNLDARPLHNILGPDDYTWRNDSSPFDPGRLDYVIYSDNILDGANQYVINTTTMALADLIAADLQLNDVVLDPTAGQFDHLPLITDFRMNSIQEFGDFNGDGQLNCLDLIELELAIAAQTDNLFYDIDGDVSIGALDIDYWIDEVIETLPGDANLDHVVDGLDFIVWNEFRFGAGGWCQGDFNHDGIVDGTDFIVWNEFKFTSALDVAVPEPSALSIGIVMSLVLVRRRRRAG